MLTSKSVKHKCRDIQMSVEGCGYICEATIIFKKILSRKMLFLQLYDFVGSIVRSTDQCCCCICCAFNRGL